MKFELEPHNRGVTAEDCLKELERVARKLDTSTLSRAQYKPHGEISSDTIVRRLGSWRSALAQIGLAACHPYTQGIPEEELFENLEQLWESLGRQPHRRDFVKPLSKFCWQVYNKHFGSFRRALEAFVASFESEQSQHPDEPFEDRIRETPLSRVVKAHRTSRTLSWRTRFLVMRRDNFKCCICGVSPALKPGTILVVDHVHPWIEGGETVMENLQTLCEPCNGGKSTLPMNEE